MAKSREVTIGHNSGRAKKQDLQKAITEAQRLIDERNATNGELKSLRHSVKEKMGLKAGTFNELVKRANQNRETLAAEDKLMWDLETMLGLKTVTDVIEEDAAAPTTAAEATDQALAAGQVSEEDAAAEDAQHAAEQPALPAPEDGVIEEPLIEEEAEEEGVDADQLKAMGSVARAKGLGEDTNPFKDGTADHAYWLVGWNQKDGELAAAEEEQGAEDQGPSDAFTGMVGDGTADEDEGDEGDVDGEDEAEAEAAAT